MSWRGILIYVENYSGKVNSSAFELLGKANELKIRIGGEVSAITLAREDVDAVVQQLISYGADRVVVYKVSSDEELANQLIHRDAIVDTVNMFKPKLVLISATPWGRSLGPRVAAKLGTGITADCLDIYVDEQGDIVQVRPAFTGNIIAHIKTLTNPVITTIRPKVLPIPRPDPSKRGEVVVKNIEELNLSNDARNIKVLGVAKVKEVKLPDVQIIVSVGRGLRSREDIEIFKEFAKMLGGELGCSKPLVDMGWCEKDRQVGFSGNIVRPRIYIACGISGAPQHIAGMKDSEYVIAINIDETAPISKYSDLLIVGNMYEIVEKAIKKISEVKKDMLTT